MKNRNTKNTEFEELKKQNKELENRIKNVEIQNKLKLLITIVFEFLKNLFD